MKEFKWDPIKNIWLKWNRGICFDDIIFLLNQDKDILKTEHHNKARYPNQKIIILAYQDYVYMIPYVKEGDIYFLKTIIPSRKAKKIFKSILE